MVEHLLATPRRPGFDSHSDPTFLLLLFYYLFYLQLFRFFGHGQDDDFSLTTNGDDTDAVTDADADTDADTDADAGISAIRAL